jgi:GNAT superfamily N-acetyltransferase
VVTTVAGACIGGGFREFNRVPDRPGKVRELLAGDPAPGLFAYLDETVVGWCGLGPRSQMGRLARSRTIPVVDDLPVWSVTCFVVRTGFRRKGVARALLASAVSYAADAHNASQPRWLMRRTF